MNSVSLFAMMTLLLTPTLTRAGEPAITGWEATGIKTQSFMRDVFPLCAESALNFQGCINAMNALAASLDTPAIVSPEVTASDRKLIGNELFPLPMGYRVYALKDATRGTLAEWVSSHQKTLKHQAELIKNSYAAWLKKPNHEEDLEQSFDLLMAKNPMLKSKASDSVLAGKMYNEYLTTVEDPHTLILPYQFLLDLQAHPDEQMIGAGASLGYDKPGKGRRLLIRSVVQDGPAMNAGLKWNDEVIAVNGKSVASDTPEKVLRWFDGEPDGILNLQIKRRNELLSISIRRGPFVKKSIESEMVNHFGTPFGYLAFKKNFFNEKADQEFKSRIAELRANGAQGLILDLRGNTGGPLEMAIKLSSLFVGPEIIVTEKANKPELAKVLRIQPTVTLTGWTDAITDLPMTLLLDGASASSSEVLAGALQDHKRAWIVGDRSFGKGSVQSGFQFQGVHLKIPLDAPIVQLQTVYRFFAPSDRTIQLVGITPNFSVPIAPGAIPEDEPVLREEDLYLNPLSAIGTPWKETRTLEVNRINQCRAERSKNAPESSPEALYRKLEAESPVHRPDYRLFSAEEILICNQR